MLKRLCQSDSLPRCRLRRSPWDCEQDWRSGRISRRVVKLLIGCLVGAVFLALVLHHVDVRKVWHEMLRAHPGPLLLACLFLLLAYLVRAERWYLTLRAVNSSLARMGTTGIFMMGIAANCILPFRLGDFMRGTMFNRRLGVNASGALVTILVEKIIDLLTIILAGGIALMALPKKATAEFHGVGGGIVLMVGLGLVLSLFFMKYVRAIVIWMVEVILRAAPGPRARISALAGEAFDALDMVAHPKMLPVLLGWSVVSWGLEGCAFWEVARAMPVLADPSAAWVAMPVATLSTALPGTPGSVGTFDFFAARTMRLLGNSHNASTAYAFLVHATVLLVPVVLGGGFFIVDYLRKHVFHKNTSN
ncbi:flippase-like domain-containing protein [Oecophyllibacter saccharovorans]|nr:flippase-like domain-containing protein [Oecophyllibacter saccharovorans]TPW36785.1 flippase-like domain-containing protein [Oecophyllibacter saccharovorans]